MTTNNATQLDPIDEIIVGYDFSETADAAVKTAAWIAQRIGARVHVGTATHGHLDATLVETFQREGKRHKTSGDLLKGQPILDSVTAHVKSRVETIDTDGITLDVEAGMHRPYDLLTEMAGLRNADLIVVGASGLGAVKRWLVGSTADKLVRGSRWPVMVVKDFRPIKRILVAVDMSEPATNALHWAWTLAGHFDAELHTINVVEVPRDLEYDLYGNFWTEDYRHRLVQKEREAYNEFLDNNVAGSSIATRHTAVGIPDDVICATAAEIDADLLIMGSHGRHGISAVVIGNTANRVLHRLPCSLMTIKGDEFVLEV